MGSSANDAKVIIPRLNTDPVWSLRPWPLIVTVAGTEFEVPAMPAADWLAWLMAPEFDLDAALEELLPGIDDLLVDGDATLDEVYETVLDMISTVSARPWWVALRLISVARTSWDVLGPDLIKRGLDPDRHSLAAWMDVLLVSIYNAMDPKDTTMFTMKLEAVPEAVGDPEADPMDSMEMDRSAFMAMGRN